MNTTLSSFGLALPLWVVFAVACSDPAGGVAADPDIAVGADGAASDADAASGDVAPGDDAADAEPPDTSDVPDTDATDADAGAPRGDTSADAANDAVEDAVGVDADVADPPDAAPAPWVDCLRPSVPLPAAPAGDCNRNATPDADDIADGFSVDCNADGTPDECQLIDDACVFYGARDFIEYDAGNLPIVISMPHGGLVRPDDIPSRAAATGDRDVNTIQAGRAVAAAIFERTGRHPHLIISQLHRDKLDANRSLAVAQDGHPETVNAWNEYHAFIDAAKRSAVQNFGGALYVDLHGLASSLTKIEIGYLLSATQLYLDDERLDHPGYAYRSSLRTLALGQPDRSFVQLIRGLDSLGGLLQAGGFDTVPSPAFPDPDYDDDGSPGNYFNGGYNTVRHGSRDGSRVSGLQIELSWAGVRDSPISRAAFGDALAAALLDFVPNWVGVDPMARSLVDVYATDPAASERGDDAQLTIVRRGDLSETIDVLLHWSGSAVDEGTLEVLPAAIRLAAGESTATVAISPRRNPAATGATLLDVRVEPSPGYNPGDASSARVHVADQETAGFRLEGAGQAAEATETALTVHRDACGDAMDVTVTLTADDEALFGVEAADFGTSTVEFNVHFEPDDASASVLIPIAGDEVVEGRESAIARAEWSGSAGPDLGAGIAELRFNVVDAHGSDAPQLWWPMSGESGVVVDHGADGFDAAILPDAVSGPRAEPGGPMGHGYLTFDGDDDLVIGPNVPLGDAFSVAFWFRVDPELPDGFRYIFGHGIVTAPNNVNVYVLDNGRVRTSVRGADDPVAYDGLDTGPGYRDGGWHHYALSVDTSGDEAVSQVHIDGELVATDARGAGGVSPTTDIHVGGRWDLSPDRDFAGDVQDLRIYHRALDADAVRLLMTAP